MARILVIDDDESFRGMLCAALSAMGHVVTASPHGRDGLAKQAADPADLVITDVVMPEKDGLETIRDMRRLQPDLKIIAMSGGGRLDDTNYLPFAKRFGAVRVLAKPFAIAELAALVTDVLAGE
jgi:DNA-binding response OmpR family regulator